MYDYREAMKQDICEAISDNYYWDLSDYADKDEFIEAAEDYFWTDDSVTGNASGSYTFNSHRAKEYVIDNMDLLHEVITEFCIDSEAVADHFINEDWEYFDVSIRCYLLNSVLWEVAKELEEAGAFVQDEEAEEAQTA